LCNLAESFLVSFLHAISNNPYFLETSVFKTLDSQPLGFIDIGVRGGIQELIEPIAKNVAALGFEPDEEEASKLSSDPEISASWAEFCLELTALSDKKRKAEMQLFNWPYNNSLLPPNEAFVGRYEMQEKWSKVGTEKIEADTLDNILFKVRKDEQYWGEFIKSDAQAAEYEILSGSKRTLSERTVALVIEVYFCEVYKGQKLFSEIEQLLRHHGFTFYGFHTMHTRSLGQLDKAKHVGRERVMYADAVFFKDPLPGAAFNEELTTRQLHILFICALILGYYDFALELATKTWAKGKEIDNIISLINDLSNVEPESTAKEVETLLQTIKNNPEIANIYVGKFVDKQRLYFDYDDV